MADYVLEEDGTTPFELEDGSGNLELEEGGWIDHTVAVDDFVNDGELPDPGIEDSASPVNRTDVNYTVNPADDVGVADGVPVKVQGHGRSPADSVAVSDSAVTKTTWTNYTVTPADTVAVSDVTNRNLNVDTGAYQREEASAEQLETEEGDSNLLLEETGGWTNHMVTPADSVALTDAFRADLNPRRVSQLPVEVVVGPTDSKARLSQEPVEVIYLGQDQKARVSQLPVEVIVQPTADAHVTQVPVEVVAAPVMDERQRYVDAIRLAYPDGMWRLDDVSGNWVDDSGTHPFIPYGSVSYQQPGPTPGWPVISVDPGGGASQPSWSNQMDDITFEAWFMYDSITADNQVIFSNVNGGNGWALTINQNGKLQVVVNGTTFLAESQTALVPGTWYHIAVVRRSGQWRYYVNGDVDTPNAGTATPGSAVTTMNLFGSSDMAASMAVAAYYERALTTTEIKEHYHTVFETVLRFPEFQAHFFARVIDPLDSGTWVVDDLTSRPLAVIFMGTNFAATDTIVTTDGLGIFRGQIGTDPDSGTVIQTATSPIYAGDGQRVSASQAICMGNSSGGIHYSATVTLTDTGFECDFDNVGAGTVVALILKDANNCGMVHVSSGVYDIGFRGRSHIATGWWDLVGNRSNMHGSWFGGGQWQSENSLDFEGVGLTAHCYPTGISRPYSSEMRHVELSNGMFGVTYHFIGPFMAGYNLRAVVPESPDGTTLTADVDGAGPGSFVVWDGMSNCGFLSKPSAAADTPVETVLADPEFAPGCVITYSASDVFQGQGSSGESPPGGFGAGGFGIALEDGFRWAVLVDGGSSDGTVPSAAYQTFDHAWISAVDPTGVHMGDLEFTDTGFIADTTDDSFGVKNVLFHAMGFPIPSVMWIPQMSRHKL